MAQKLILICEVCGKAVIMTPEQAFNEGWDYPPKMGSFGVISPRTCGDCNMTKTLWWALVQEKRKLRSFHRSNWLCLSEYRMSQQALLHRKKDHE